METLSDIKIINLLQEKEIYLFGTDDFARIFKISNRNTLHKRLQRLTYRGVIKRLRQGEYSLATDKVHDFSVANFVYQPSYISLESALSYYGIITGITYAITSITVKKAVELEIDKASFSYAQVSSRFYWGYQKIDNYLIAEPAKAMLDWLYLGYKGLRKTEMDEVDYVSLDKSMVIHYARLLNNNSFIKFVRQKLR